MNVKDIKAYHYADDVLSGNIIACNHIHLACKRFMSDLDRDDIYLDFEEINMVTNFFEKILYLPEKNEPVELPLFQAFALQNLYGFKYKKTGLRRFRNVLIEVARKNAKTYFAAGISLYELLCGGEKFPYIMNGANSRDQALLCTDMVGRLVRSSPELQELEESGALRLFSYGEVFKKIVFHNPNGGKGTIEAMPKNPGDGQNPSIGIVDELHEADNNVLIRKIKSGWGQRTQPYCLVISSQGHNKTPVSPLYGILRKRAIDMLTGKVEDDRNFAMLFEQDNNDDWDNPDCIEKANPMCLYTPGLKEDVLNDINEAKIEGGFTEVDVKTKRCGVWTDVASVWIEDSIWVANNDVRLKVEDLKGEKCWGGLDLSSTRDLTSFCALFQLELWGETKYPLLNWNWSPSEYRNKIDYTKWIQNGYIRTIDGNHIDQSFIFRDLLEIFEMYKFQKLNYDKHLADWLAPMMSDTGLAVTPLNMQGYQISQSIKELERAILGKKVIHFDNPVMRWANGNTMPKIDAKGNLQLIKENEYNKIDPMVAAALSFDAMLSDKAEVKIESGIEIWN